MELCIAITINMDSAAFEHDDKELWRILQIATNRICEGVDGRVDVDAKLFDINGNSVGKVLGVLDG